MLLCRTTSTSPPPNGQLAVALIGLKVMTQPFICSGKHLEVGVFIWK